ncbi:MAG: sugar phosphate isomerase/epimerase [Planctomycetaceae bacterium]|jgi:sugar phosphate isomerase/epimerase|nr:sugar phosphate isomerase/epimerase [Planctomycetaceae bacterium]
MGKIAIGVNMEYVRHEDKNFEWGAAKAKELGYEYVEPMVHWGRELLSEAGYFHSVSMWDDPYRIRRTLEKHGIKASALSAHCPLCKPDASTDYLKQAVRFAAEVGAPVVCTDEGPKQPWTTQDEDFAYMKYVLKEASFLAEVRNVKIGIEPHQQYTVKPELYDKIIALAGSGAVGANFDTGNSYLAGQDPYIWLEKIKTKLVHLHAKDISIQQSDAERGAVTGTPVGCACGDGVIDWAKVIAIVKPLPQDIVFSVECGTVEQAARSIEHLRKLI